MAEDKAGDSAKKGSAASNATVKNTTAERLQSLQLAAAEFLKGKPPWMMGVYVALRRFLYIAVPVVIWCVLLVFEGILPQSLKFGLTIVIVALLFLLSIPLSLLQRFDLLLAGVGSYTGNSQALMLLVALLYVLLNFVVIGAIAGWLRGKRRR